MKTGLITLAAFVSSLSLLGCSQDAQVDVKPETVSKEVAHKAVKMAGGPKAVAENMGNRVHVMEALQSLTRSEADRADDKARKAAGVMQFSGIWPGMSVVELEAGGGYYSEIISHMVGEKGRVYVQNPPAFDAFLKPEDIIARFGEDGQRLPNVTRTKSNFDALEIPDNSADVVTWFLGPHELFYTPKNSPDGLGDAATSYAEIFRVLKPGGKFIALDHGAEPGAPESTGGDTHRIDPAAVQRRAEAAGLTLHKTSKLLLNPADDYSLNVFDPAVRRKTDRFLHMYVKPE